MYTCPQRTDTPASRRCGRHGPPWRQSVYAEAHCKPRSPPPSLRSHLQTAGWTPTPAVYRAARRCSLQPPVANAFRARPLPDPSLPTPWGWPLTVSCSCEVRPGARGGHRRSLSEGDCRRVRALASNGSVTGRRTWRRWGGRHRRAGAGENLPLGRMRAHCLEEAWWAPEVGGVGRNIRAYPAPQRGGHWKRGRWETEGACAPGLRADPDPLGR